VKILLVRLRLIGDVVFTTPLLRALKRTLPEAHLAYLVESTAAPVVTGNRLLDDVIVVPHTRGATRLADDWRLAHRLRASRYDVVVDLHGGPRSAWLTWLSRAPRRVGYDVPGRTWMYTHVVHRPRTLRPRHSVLNQWDLLAAVDPRLATPPDPTVDRVEMTVAADAGAAVDARLARLGVPAGARVIVIHVSAGNPFRRWPETHFADLVSRLAREGVDRWVVVMSGPSDGLAAARVIATARAAAGDAAERIVEGNDFRLDELRALFNRSALFIGGDSGPLHVAATSDVAIVGLYGPTLPERSAPWRPPDVPTASVDAGTLPCRPCDQRHCVPGDYRCLTGIGADAVGAAASQLLERTT